MAPDHQRPQRSFDVDDLAQQGQVRSELRAHFAAVGLSDDLAGDALVVVSELVANAFEHAGARNVVVIVSTSDRGERWEIEIAVAYRPVRVGVIPERPAMPPAQAARGRGLAIVEALSDTTAIERAPDGTVTSRCVVAGV